MRLLTNCVAAERVSCIPFVSHGVPPELTCPMFSHERYMSFCSPLLFSVYFHCVALLLTFNFRFWVLTPSRLPTFQSYLVTSWVYGPLRTWASFTTEPNFLIIFGARKSLSASSAMSIRRNCFLHVHGTLQGREK